jgi:hypothetical protein
VFLALSGHEWALPSQTETHGKWQFFTGRTWLLIPGLVLASAAFLLFGSQRFSLASSFCWLAGVFATAAALWNKAAEDRSNRVSLQARVQQLLKEKGSGFSRCSLLSLSSRGFPVPV